jgi:hypothetical protein
MHGFFMIAASMTPPDMRRHAPHRAVVPLLVALWPGAGAGHHHQAPDDVPSEVAFVWFDQLYSLVKTERITAPPPPGSTAWRPSPSTKRWRPAAVSTAPWRAS